jgi:hypothetical protein
MHWSRWLRARDWDLHIDANRVPSVVAGPRNQNKPRQLNKLAVPRGRGVTKQAINGRAIGFMAR